MAVDATQKTDVKSSNSVHFIKFTILSLPIGKGLGFHVGAASNRDKCDLNDFISRQDAALTNSGLAATFLSLNRFGKSIRVDSRIKFTILRIIIWIMPTNQLLFVPR